MSADTTVKPQADATAESTAEEKLKSVPVELDTDKTKTEEVKEVDDKKQATNGTVVTEELQKKIVKQIEYYFGNYNLPRDKFLSEQVTLDNGLGFQWKPMVKFKRLADMSTDHKVIRNALKKSELMEVDDKNDRIRRSPAQPLPFFGDDLKAETLKRTIYCKGIPKTDSVTLDQLLEHFQPYGPFETIHKRQYVDRVKKTTGFKGSILIVFHTEEKAKEFMDLDDVQFNGMPLLRKWHKDYLDQKTEEIKERKARKEARLKQLEAEGANKDNPQLSNIEPIPRGSFLFASGFPNTTSREDIRDAFTKFTDDVAFIDFSKGDTEGYIRLATPFSNKDILSVIGDNFMVNGGEIKVRLVEGEEEDEQVKKAEAAKIRTHTNRKRKFGGGGRGRGGFNKRKRYFKFNMEEGNS